MGATLYPEHGRQQEAWSAYLAWNNAIAEEYFKGKQADLPVYLDMESEVLERIGQSLTPPKQNPQETFINVVKATLNLEPKGRSTFSQHIQAKNKWKRKGRNEIPPFLGILSFLSLVAETMRSDEQYSASNYTDRLCNLLAMSDKHRQRVKNDFRKQLTPLWNELNIWLLDNEGSLGLPTAYPFDSRVHVGIPISQALVREHDRQCFKHFFSEYRLDPGQHLPVLDMVDLLSEWISNPHSNISSSLKNLLKDRSLKERIGSIACQELEAWKGDLDETNSSSSNRASLYLAGVVRSQPIPRLVLQIYVNTAQSAPPGKYEDTTTSDTYLLRASDESRVSLSPPPSVPNTLITNLEIRNQDGFTLHHKPRRIVPLKLDKTSQIYVESSRTELNDIHMLLVHDTLAESAISHLNNIALEDFRVWKSNMQGLPEDWILITNVSIINIIDPRNDDLAILTPRGRYQVTLLGGFSLPGRKVYDVKNPPAIRLAAPYEESLALSIESKRTLASSKSLKVKRDLIDTVETIELGEFNLVEGDYLIQLLSTSKSSKILSTTNLRLRSSSYPRRLSKDQNNLHHDPANNPIDTLSASEIVIPSGGIIRGASIPNSQARQLLDLDQTHQGERSTNWGSPNDDHDDPPLITSSSVVAPNCLLTGAHYWLLEEQSLRQKFVLGVCKHCKLEKWYLGIRKYKPRSHKAIKGCTVMTKPKVISTDTLIANGDHPYLTMDNLLDAITFAQKGSWSEFQHLASQINDAPWFPLESARMLSALGHIEVALNPRTLRPSEWAISPSTLSTLPDSTDAILCGARWPELLERINEDTEAIGGSTKLIENGVGPKTFVVQHLTLQELRLVAESTGAALQMKLALTESASIKLAQQLPSLNDIAKVLPTTSLSEHRVELFDTSRGSWKSTDDAHVPGAYRITTNPWTFAWRSKLDKELRVGNSRIVKYLAGADMEQALLTYDQANKRLIVPFGAPLPGLYERAVVLCSGFLPNNDKNKLYYESVPECIADAILKRMNIFVNPQRQEPSHGSD